MKDDYLTIFENFLNTRHPFSFARYGDGEWKAILGDSGQNCDGHKYFPDLGLQLASIVKSQPEYYMGMQKLAKRLLGRRIDSFIGDTKIEWINADLFHHASDKGRLKPFFKIFSASPVVVVGPQHLRGLDKYFAVEHFVQVPQKNCWLEFETTLQQVSQILGDKKYHVVLFCSSMMSNVLIDRLYKKNGPHATLLDMGSVFDPYVGLKSRSYHQKILNELRQS